MKNHYFRLDLAFDGRPYRGWQQQPRLVTVQGRLLQALQIIFPSLTRIVGCGRTDTGVHAHAYSASGEVPNHELQYVPEDIEFHLGKVLPPSINVRRFHWYSEPFDARREALARRYIMRLYPGRPPEALQGLVSRVPGRVNPLIFHRTMKRFLGCHDFTAFAQGKLCRSTINAISTGYSAKEIEVVLTGNRFHRHQVRMMVGAAVQVACGQLSEEVVLTGLREGKYHSRFARLEAGGLALQGIWYADGWNLPAFPNSGSIVHELSREEKKWWLA